MRLNDISFSQIKDLNLKISLHLTGWICDKVNIFSESPHGRIN